MTIDDIKGSQAGKSGARFPTETELGSFDELLWVQGRDIMEAWMQDARKAGRVDEFNICKMAEELKMSRNRFTKLMREHYRCEDELRKVFQGCAEIS